MGVFEVIKSWRVTERCSFFNQRLFLELFADETIAKIPSHGTNGEINPTWIGWFSVGFHVNIPYMDPMGWFFLSTKTLVGWVTFWGFYLYTNREYHKPIIRIPWNWAVSHGEKIIPIDTCRVVGQDKAAYDFLELHALGYDAWRRLRLMILDGKMLSQPDFLVGKNTQIYTPIYN